VKFVAVCGIAPLFLPGGAAPFPPPFAAVPVRQRNVLYPAPMIRTLATFSSFPEKTIAYVIREVFRGIHFSVVERDVIPLPPL